MLLGFRWVVSLARDSDLGRVAKRWGFDADFRERMAGMEERLEFNTT
jgi:hypothetical protein